MDISSAPAALADISAQLEQIWLRALERPLADPTASFFDNEGDSLGATIVLIDIKELFGVDVSLEEFFDNPTISGLTDVIVRQQEASRRL